MTTLLVLTVGQSDVQLVLDGVRHELDTKTCGMLHDQIVQRAWQIVAAPRKDQQRATALPEGELTLCTPKLDAVLRYFDDGALPAAALIFETRRTIPGDPRYAGSVLEKRLKEHGVRQIARHSFLSGEARLEDPMISEDSVVRLAIVEELSNEIARQVQSVVPARIVVATTGGLAAANSVIEELVRLHAVGRSRVESLEVPDGALAEREDCAIAERFHPAAGLQARWHALSLIENGNLLGAWGAVSHLENEPGQDWIRVVKWLARFVSSLPNDGCEIPVLNHQRMSVRAALRVELALRAGDIPRAVHGSVAFFEAALWDHLAERTSRHASKRQFKFHASPPNGLVRERDATKLGKLSKTRQNEDRSRPFVFREQADGCDWYWIDDNEICAIQIASHYLELADLTKLGQAIASGVRELRNDVAHNEPTSQLMQDAHRRMRDAGLWSPNNEFLSQPLIQSVLRELGEERPASLCTELLAEVRSRLWDVTRPLRNDG